jgi:hypothetical protein
MGCLFPAEPERNNQYRLDCGKRAQTDIPRWTVVFADVRSASAAAAFALTWATSVDKTRALNDRR